jgi:hypothetical protein
VSLLSADTRDLGRNTSFLFWPYTFRKLALFKPSFLRIQSTRDADHTRLTEQVRVAVALDSQSRVLGSSLSRDTGYPD